MGRLYAVHDRGRRTRIKWLRAIDIIDKIPLSYSLLASVLSIAQPRQGWKGYDVGGCLTSCHILLAHTLLHKRRSGWTVLSRARRGSWWAPKRPWSMSSEICSLVWSRRLFLVLLNPRSLKSIPAWLYARLTCQEYATLASVPCCVTVSIQLINGDIG